MLVADDHTARQPPTLCLSCPVLWSLPTPTAAPPPPPLGWAAKQTEGTGPPERRLGWGAGRWGWGGRRQSQCLQVWGKNGSEAEPQMGPCPLSKPSYAHILWYEC